MTNTEMMAKAKEIIKSYNDGKISRIEKINKLIAINYYEG